MDYIYKKIKGIKPKRESQTQEFGITPQAKLRGIKNPIFCLRSDNIPTGALSSLIKIKNIFTGKKWMPAAIKISSAVLLAVFFFILTAKNANAGWLEDATIDAIYKIISSLIYIVLYFLSFFITLASELLNGIINVGMNVPQSIKSGWEISLGITNSIFIFGILYIAFATIFGIENYSAKKLLPKFIVIALLINFSFFFSAQILKLSNDFAGTFLKLMGNNPAERLSGSVNLQSIWMQRNVTETGGAQCFYQGTSSEPCDPTKAGNVCYKIPMPLDARQEQLNANRCDATYYQQLQQKNKEKGENVGLIEAFISMIMSLLFNILFSIIVLFVLLAYVVFFIIRNITIWILLVLAPFAWALSIFPGKGQAQWDRWWGKFINQCLFAPVALFFLYLATTMAGAFNQPSQIFDSEINKAGFGGVALSTFMSAIAIGGFAIAGLLVAQELGIAGANTIRGWGEKAGKWAAKGAAKGTALRAAASIPTGMMSKISAAAQKGGITGGILKYSGMGKAAEAISKGGTAAKSQLALQKMERKEKGVFGWKEKLEKPSKEFKEKVAGMSYKQQQELAGTQQFTQLGRFMRQAGEETLAERANYFETLKESGKLPKGVTTREELEEYKNKQKKLTDAQKGEGLTKQKKKKKDKKGEKSK